MSVIAPAGASRCRPAPSGADARLLVSAISRRGALSRPRAVASTLPDALPFYHRVSISGELQFIITST